MEHPVFDSARDKMKRFIRQLEKSQEAFENSLYMCFKSGSNNMFLLQGRLGPQTREHPYLASAANVTTGGGTDNTHYAINL